MNPESWNDRLYAAKQYVYDHLKTTGRKRGMCMTVGMFKGALGVFVSKLLETEDSTSKPDLQVGTWEPGATYQRTCTWCPSADCISGVHGTLLEPDPNGALWWKAADGLHACPSCAKVVAPPAQETEELKWEPGAMVEITRVGQCPRGCMVASARGLGSRHILDKRTTKTGQVWNIVGRPTGYLNVCPSCAKVVAPPERHCDSTTCAHVPGMVDSSTTPPEPEGKWEPGATVDRHANLCVICGGAASLGRHKLVRRARNLITDTERWITDAPSGKQELCSDCARVVAPPEGVAKAALSRAQECLDAALKATEERPRTTIHVGGTAEAWPKNVEEAVKRLLAELPEETLKSIRLSEDGDLVRFHHSLGRAIRNKFGLWKDNKPLLDACGEEHPDDASGVIMRALWNALKNEKVIIGVDAATKVVEITHPQGGPMAGDEVSDNAGRASIVKSVHDDVAWVRREGALLTMSCCALTVLSRPPLGHLDVISRGNGSVELMQDPFKHIYGDGNQAGTDKMDEWTRDNIRLQSGEITRIHHAGGK